MSWDIEYTDEFGDWWDSLSETQQTDVAATVELLAEKGPNLPSPYSSGIEGTVQFSLRELRIQSQGRPIRVFCTFDPRRVAILLMGGDKTGDKRFYERLAPLAERLYEIYLEEIRQEGLI